MGRWVSSSYWLRRLGSGLSLGVLMVFANHFIGSPWDTPFLLASIFGVLFTVLGFIFDLISAGPRLAIVRRSEMNLRHDRAHRDAQLIIRIPATWPISGKDHGKFLLQSIGWPVVAAILLAWLWPEQLLSGTPVLTAIALLNYGHFAVSRWEVRGRQSQFELAESAVNMAKDLSNVSLKRSAEHLSRSGLTRFDASRLARWLELDSRTR